MKEVIAFTLIQMKVMNQPHIHIKGQKGRMKVWLSNLRIARVKNVPDHEQTKLLEIVETNQAKFLQAWNDFRQGRK